MADQGELANPAEVKNLMDAAAYEAYVARKGQGSFGLMRYLPKSPAERQEMLAAIGADSIDELFRQHSRAIPAARNLKLPGPFSEAEIIRYFQERANENSLGYTSFLGAGVYNHLRSVVTDAIIQRGEFLTSYTPYQAEITPGHAASDLRIPNADVPAHRARSGECVDVGRLHGNNRSGVDGGADDWSDAGAGGAFVASGIPGRAEDLCQEFGVASKKSDSRSERPLDRRQCVRPSGTM